MESIDWEFAGLPLHPLFVHAVAVLIPLSAIMLVLTAVWPAAARKLTFLTPLMAVAAGAFALLAHTSGEWLEKHTTSTAAIRAHTANADLMNPAAVALAAIAIVLWLWQWYSRPPRPLRPALRRTVGIILAVIAIAIAVYAVVVVVVVGDSGARAVWGG